MDRSINQQIKKFTPCAHQESALNIIRVMAVRAIIFLTAREVKPNVGTLLVALDSGLVQVWTHHPAAGFLGAFTIIHATGDCATSLATDPENQFLITGFLFLFLRFFQKTDLRINIFLNKNPQLFIASNIKIISQILIIISFLLNASSKDTA